jgi:hypothetical protein
MARTLSDVAPPEAIMSDRHCPDVINPATAIGGGEQGPFPFDLYERYCLAQGDSWFSIGALPPTMTTRVIAELQLLRSTVIVNCAYPGAKLQRMTDTMRSPQFLNLLGGRLAQRWHAVLLSGGGNDLIEAAGSPPTAPPEQRLLRTPAERGADPSPGDYISEPGWSTFAAHIDSVFSDLVAARDASPLNTRTPIVWHNYARVMPRPAGAGLGFGPWLLPSLLAFAVPDGDLLAVSDQLTSRLKTLVDDIVARRLAADPGCALFVADSMSAGIVTADAGSTGVSGDWINEIHLTREGYGKAATAWQAVLDPILG